MSLKSAAALCDYILEILCLLCMEGRGGHGRGALEGTEGYSRRDPEYRQVVVKATVEGGAHGPKTSPEGGVVCLTPRNIPGGGVVCLIPRYIPGGESCVRPPDTSPEGDRVLDPQKPSLEEGGCVIDP